MSLPVGVDEVAFVVDLPDGVAADGLRWTVRDVSPFPRPCADGGGCALIVPEG
ncbi:MAG: hypothetical protein R2939_03690 [Kofleriaceae bacterium]